MATVNFDLGAKNTSTLIALAVRYDSEGDQDNARWVADEVLSRLFDDGSIDDDREIRMDEIGRLKVLFNTSQKVEFFARF